MKEYNFDEMQEMQAKALERVREMQARAQNVAKQAERELSDGNDNERSGKKDENTYKENFYMKHRFLSNLKYISQKETLDLSHY